MSKEDDYGSCDFEVIGRAELMGGPLDGKVIEVLDAMGDGRFPCKIGNRVDDTFDAPIAWYARDAAGCYRYTHTQRRGDGK